VSLYDWLLFFHVTGAFLLLGGSVAAGVLNVAALARERPSEIALLLRLTRPAAAAISAGLLMNARFLPMGIAAASATRGGRLRRAAEGQAVVDASWAMASDGRGGFDRAILLGGAIPQAAGWWGGTIIGAVGGTLLGDPKALGLDAMFPAFYLALLVQEMDLRATGASALLGAAIALALTPVAPPGIPIIAAVAACLIGLRR
jgi:predicted branched-subunit amino acid permease